MSARIRLALCAWIATMASASALLPLVEPSGWLLQVALLLGLQSAVGAAARRTPLPRPLVAAVQALLALLLLTFVFVRNYAFLGLVPGPDGLATLGALVTEGSEDVGRFATPAPLTEGIRLLLIGGVLLVGLLVDVLAVTYRSAAPAGLPLLALYSVAAGLAQDGTRWLWFLCAAAGFLLLLLAEGRDRLAQWGQLFSGGPGRPARAASPAYGDRTSAPLRHGHRIGAAALGIALLVPALLPSLDSGLLDPTGRGGGGNGTVSAVNPLVALQDSLNQPENRTVLTYESDAESEQDLYMRIVSLDQFDGSAWKPSERRIQAVPNPLPQPIGLSAGVETETVTTRVAAADWYAQNWLPMPYPAQRVQVDGRWRFEPVGRTLVGDRGQDTKGARYEVESLVVRPTAEQLANAPQPPANLQREYTSVPDSLPGVVAETARSVTAGSANNYERALALQEWFAREGGFSYSTEVRAGTGSRAIARFLEQKEGFCVHFAFSMGAMARTLGIPARVAVGFTPGRSAGSDAMEIGLQDAHAWPELYFEGVGWTRFEPTPSRGSTPGYAQPALPEPGEEETQFPEEEQAPEVPSEAPSAEEECPPELRRAGECGEEEQDAGAVPTEDGFPWQPVLLGTGSTALAALLLLLPLLWRTRARSRRVGRPAQRLDPAARTLAAWQEMLDTGWDHGVVPEDSATPRAAAARLAASGRLDPEAARSAERLAAGVEQVLYAPSPQPAAGQAADVQRVRSGLRASAPRGERLRALLLPRSAVRVVWRASAGWTAVVGRQRQRAERLTRRLRRRLQRA